MSNFGFAISESLHYNEKFINTVKGPDLSCRVIVCQSLSYTLIVLVVHDFMCQHFIFLCLPSKVILQPNLKAAKIMRLVLTNGIGID